MNCEKPDKLSWNLVDDLEKFHIGTSGAVKSSFKGKEALYFEEGGTAVLLKEEINYHSFLLQAEVAIPEDVVAFIGLVFGAKDQSNYELIYVSPGNKGIGEIQYDPYMNGSSTWQIYNGPHYQIDIPFFTGEWTKLTLKVDPDTVSVFVGETTSPQLIIPKVQLGSSIGKIGVWGYLPCYIRNLSILEIPTENNISCAVRKNELDIDFLTEWSVSQPYFNQDDAANFEELAWTKVVVEDNGTINFNRLYSCEKNNVIQAISSFYLPEATQSDMSFGYSDVLRLWVNENEIFKGTWKWDPPNYDGRIRANHTSIRVKWKSGINVVRAEVKNEETVFGWGLALRTGIITDINLS
ncbi:hypothetical protein [Paenibacillus agilis]|uniref:Uncharacterized protein n=1 Tax=Paenibacillus agilis TaxID=3020863 RepID=A0A559J0Z0_9BACL|nr:hypothetical protein [Paenibacillus agilis]TVX93550.1 hypothetical protein FPZ44_11095 [Paenibacillus agilis]